LKINCKIGRVGCMALAQLLFVNTSLQNFTLQLDELSMDPVESVDDEDGVEGSSQRGSDGNVGQDSCPRAHPTEEEQASADPIIMLPNALESNQTMEYFSLCGKARMSKAGHLAFATLLRHNMTLLQCEVDMEGSATLPEEVLGEARMFLRLNQLGRKELLQGDRTSDQEVVNDDESGEDAYLEKWIMALWSVRHDMDALFYLLSVNPTLCATASTGRQSAGTQSVRRRTYSRLTHLQFKYYFLS
jgi:hypothetical protein